MKIGIFAFVAAVLSAANNEWVGSRECRVCHTAIYASYQKTQMARSSGGIASLPHNLARNTFDHKRSGYRYTIDTTLCRLSFTVGKGEQSATQPLLYYIGSGEKARSFATGKDGFLYLAPVAYYTAKAQWDLSPGYSRYDQPFLTRPILPGCLQCHSSAVRNRPLTQNGYRTPPFLEGGVACERCHGPGAAHIAAVRARTGKPAIVNPAKLQPENRDSICSQCHLSGEIRVRRLGKTETSFRPGDRLSDHVAVFTQGHESTLRVSSHVENLAQSICKKSSGDRLWCGTCHNPHTVPDAKQRVSWFRSKCLTCHEPQSCKAPPSARTGAGDDCTACHMPKNAVEDAQHVAYTDHAIRRNPIEIKPSANGPLTPFAATQSDPRDIALAYAILASRNGNEKNRSRAYEGLGNALKKEPKDPEALLYFADLLERRGDRAGAVAAYRQAIGMDPAQLTGSVNLGAIEMERGDYPEAISLWMDALSKNPALSLVRTNLAAALRRMGRLEEAESILDKAVEWNPILTAPRR